MYTPMTYFNMSLMEMLQTIWDMDDPTVRHMPDVVRRNLRKIPIWFEYGNMLHVSTRDRTCITMYFYDIYQGVMSISVAMSAPNSYVMDAYTEHNEPKIFKQKSLHILEDSLYKLHIKEMATLPNWYTINSCECKLTYPGCAIKEWAKEAKGNVLLGRSNSNEAEVRHYDPKSPRLVFIGVLEAGSDLYAYAEIPKESIQAGKWSKLTEQNIDKNMKGRGRYKGADHFVFSTKPEFLISWRSIYDKYFSEYAEEDREVLDMIDAKIAIEKI